MIKTLLRAIRRPFKRSGKKTSRSSLVGMYLTQTNGHDGYTPEHISSRTRRNSKYSRRRERV
ncbi:hypothetical protein N9059_00290 [bacterium]|nr:hypothetical protein [bacterium]